MLSEATSALENVTFNLICQHTAVNYQIITPPSVKYKTGISLTYTLLHLTCKVSSLNKMFLKLDEVNIHVHVHIVHTKKYLFKHLTTDANYQ